MTVNNTVTYVSYVGNSATKAFAFNFRALEEEHIKVLLQDLTTGVFTTVLSTDYTVALEAASGTVIYPLSGDAIPSTKKIFIIRNTDFLQGISVENQQRYFPNVAERVWDKLTLLIQELADGVSRAVKVPYGETGLELVPGEDDQALIFSNGKLVGGPTTAEIAAAGDYAALVAELAEDLIGKIGGAGLELYVTDGVETDFMPPITVTNTNNLIVEFEGKRRYTQQGDWSLVDGKVRISPALPEGILVAITALNPLDTGTSSGGMITLTGGETLQEAVNRNFSFASHEDWVAVLDRPWEVGAVAWIGMYLANPVGHVYDGASSYYSFAAGWRPYTAASPKHWNAAGDDDANDTTAVQAWATYLRTVGGEAFVHHGTYKVSSVYLFPEAHFTIRGAGRGQSVFKITSTSRLDVGLKFSHSGGITRNSYLYTLEDFDITADTGCKACLLEHINASGFSMSNVRVNGYHGGQGMRFAGVWNSHINQVSVWGCGHNVPYKTVDASITFTISNGGTTLTASAAVFAAGDVGKTITLIDNQVNQTFTIAAYGSTTSVTVDAAQKAFTAVRGTFGGIRGDMTSGSPSLTIEAAQLTSDDIGRVVYVTGAGAALFTGRKPLRSTITGVSGTTITLAHNAAANVADAELIFDPAVEFGEVTDITNELSTINFRIEQHRGTGLVGSGTRVKHFAMKLHGVNNGHNELATNIQALLFNTSASFIGCTFEQSVCSNVARVLVTAATPALSPSFVDMEGLVQYGKGLIHCRNSASGVVNPGQWKFSGASVAGIAALQFTSDGTAFYDQHGATVGGGGALRYSRDYKTLLPQTVTDADLATTEGVWFCASSASGIPVAAAGAGRTIPLASGTYAQIYKLLNGYEWERFNDGSFSDWVPVGDPTPQHFDFEIGQVAGQTAKFQAGMDYAKENAVKLRMPAGEYLLEGEITCFYLAERLQPYGLIGAGRDITKIYTNVTDPSVTILNWTRNDGDFQDFNQADKEIGGFSMFRVVDDGTPGPCFIDVSGLGNSTLHDIYLGNNRNTSLRMSRNANLTLRNVYANGGGYSFPTLDTTGMTVSGSSGSPTLTISGGTPALTAHVGMTVYIAGTSPRPIVATIQAAPTSGSYTLTENLPQAVSAKSFYLGAPLVSGSSGGTTLTSNIATFNANQEGMFAYVKLDGGGIQRVKIVEVTSSTTATITCAKDTGDPLSTAAGLPANVTSSEIVVAQVDVTNWLTRGTGLTDLTNDMIFLNTSFHRGAGIELVLQDVVRARFPDLKLHGFNDPITDTSYAVSAIWMDNISFKADGMIDSNFVSRERVKAFRVRDSSVLLGPFYSTCEAGSVFLDMASQSGSGRIVVQDMRGSFESADEVIRDANSTRKALLCGSFIGTYDAAAAIRSFHPAPVFIPLASDSPLEIGQVTMEKTSNTVLTFTLKGSDGVDRSGTITLS